MRFVYLGLFSRICDWVLSHIFEPVFRFVSNLLNVVLTWVFQEVLAPVLMPVLQGILEFAIKLWVEIYSTHLYLLFSGLLKLLDYLETAFDVFIGLRDVTYDSGGTIIEGSLIEVLMQQKNVNQIFWVLTLAGLGIAMILTIIATAKSALDLDFENKRPVTKVLASMMKTFIQFFMIPFLVYFVLRLSAIILRGVTTALTPEGTTSLGRMVFVIASLDAAKVENLNVSSSTRAANIGPLDSVRKPFYLMDAKGVSSKDYGKLSDVGDAFFLGEFDYLIGFIAAIFLLFTIGICLVIFIQRIFELLLLYLVSPYFVSTMPLDDGEKFNRWREMFVGKCFSGFGSAIGMRLFLLVCPIIMGNEIRLAADAGLGGNASPEMEYMMKLFFIAGGAWAVYKSGPMITSLISSQAGQSEMQTANMVGGMLYGSTLGMAMAHGGRALSSMGGKLGSKLGGKAGAGLAGKKGGGLAGASGGGKSQAFMGDKKKKEKWKWNDIKVNSLNQNRQKAKDDAIRAAGALKAAGRLNVRGRRGAGALNRGGLKGAKALGAGALGAGGLKEAKALGAGGLERAGALGAGGLEGTGAFSPAVPDKQGTEGPNPKKTGVKGHNIHMGSFLTRQYNEDGSMKFRLMGFGYGRDAEGKTNSIRLPGLKLNQMKDGHYMVSKFSALPGVKIARTETDAGIKFSSLSLMGFGYNRSEEGKEYRLGKSLVVQKGADGSSRYQLGSQVRTKDAFGDVQYNLGGTTIQKDGDGSRRYQRGDTSYTRVMGENGAMDRQFTGPVTLHLKTPERGEDGQAAKSRLESIRIGSVSYDRSGTVYDLRVGKKPEN